MRIVVADGSSNEHFQKYIQTLFPYIQTNTHDIKSWNNELHH